MKIKGSHGMTEEGYIRERMRSEEVEDVFGHCLVIHRTCVWRRTVVAEILRCGWEAFNSGESLIERCETH